MRAAGRLNMATTRISSAENGRGTEKVHRDERLGPGKFPGPSLYRSIFMSLWMLRLEPRPTAAGPHRWPTWVGFLSRSRLERRPSGR